MAVTSDRGLCGGLNSNITKYTKGLFKTIDSGRHSVSRQAVCGSKLHNDNVPPSPPFSRA